MKEEDLPPEFRSPSQPHVAEELPLEMPPQQLPSPPPGPNETPADPFLRRE